MWMFNRLRLFWDTVKEATESVWSPQGPGNTLEARDSQIQGTLQQNAPMYLRTNPHGKICCSPPTWMLPSNTEIWAQIFQGSLCFTFPPPYPWFEPQHSVWQGSIHGSHWIFGIFNSEIEMFLEGKQVRRTMPHALIKRVVAQHTCPISQPKTRSKSLAKTWA